MSVIREKIFEQEGEGILKPKTDIIEIPVKFTCCQYFDGTIEGTIKLTEENHVQYAKVFHENTEFNLCAKLEKGEMNIEALIVSHISINMGKIFELRDIRFTTDHLELKNREISSNSSKKLCKFDISNLKSFKTFFDIDIGAVAFLMLKNEKEIWEDIENYKRSSVTGFIQITLDQAVRLDSIKDYKSMLNEKIEKILLLTSLAQGTFIDWASFELFEQINENDYERVYSERKTIRNNYSSRHEIIHFIALSDYLKSVYPNYTDKLDKNQGFNFAIHWYLESLNLDILESKYMKLFTVLELLIFRFISLQEKEYILKEEEFKKFKKELIKEMKKLLINSDVDETHRASLYSNLNCINRYDFETNLKSFLKHYTIGFSDLIDDLKILIKIRNNITHRGLSEIEFAELINAHDKILTLIQRIFLSILNYQGDYYNWIKKNYEQFNQNPNNEYRV